MAVETRVIRPRSDRLRGSATVGRQPVAGAAEGLDRSPVEGPVHLVAQVPHVHLHNVGVALEVKVPDVVEHVTLAHHGAAVSQFFQRLGGQDQQIRAQRETNRQLQERNAALEAEVRDLKVGLEAIEERARSELGMIRQDEIFFQLLEASPAAAPREPATR